jgi:hypothetical protein
MFRRKAAPAEPAPAVGATADGAPPDLPAPGPAGSPFEPNHRA